MTALNVATHSTRTVARPRLRERARTTTVSGAVPLAVAIALLPLLRPAGPGNTSPVDVPMAIAVVACTVGAARSGRRFHVPFVVPVGMLVAAGAVGAIHGRYPLEGIVALLQDLFLLAWCAAIATASSDASGLHLLVRTWVWASVVWAAVLVGAVVTGQTAIAGITQRDGSRAALTFGDANLAANYFVVSFFVVWAARWPARRSRRLLVGALLLAALATTGSNGGLLSLLVGATTALTIETWRRRGPALALGALAVTALAAGSVVVAVSSSRLQQAAQTSNIPILRDSIGRTDTSARQRQLLLDETLGLTSESGWLGIGPNATKASLDAVQAPFVKEAHDDYLAALVERGALGALGLLLLWVTLGRAAWLACTARSPAVLDEVLPRPGGLVGGMAAIAVAGFFYQTLHFRHAWALFGLVAALAWWRVHVGAPQSQRPADTALPEAMVTARRAQHRVLAPAAAMRASGRR